MLQEVKVDVYFEEQNLHSIDPTSEFYISIYGSIAQSESENISHNVAWGKAQRKEMCLSPINHFSDTDKVQTENRKSILRRR